MTVLKVWRFLCWLLVGALFPGFIAAQYPSFTSTHYTTQNIGLSHNTVLNMTEDEAGFIWISTMDGLNRFDGKTMKIYRHNPADTTSLSDSFIHGLVPDKEDMYWIGTRNGGINLLNPKTDRIQRIEHTPNDAGSIPDSPVSVIYRDSRDSMWVGFFTGLLGFYDRSEDRFLPMRMKKMGTEKPVTSVNVILEMNDGSFFFSSLEGLYYIPAHAIQAFRVDPESQDYVLVEQIPVAPNDPTPDSNILHIDDTGTLWVERIGQDMVALNTSEIPAHIQKSLASGALKSSTEHIIIQREGYFLKGAPDGKLIVVDTIDHSQTMINPTGKETQGGAKLFEDSKGRIWFYTWGDGFHLLQERKGIEHYTSKDGLPSDFILGFEDEGDATWIATNNGLAKRTSNGQIISYHNKINGYPDDTIWALCRDNLGLWVGTRHDGLFLIPDNELRKKRPKAQNFSTHNSFLPNYDVHDILRDSRGWLWLIFEGDGAYVIRNVEAWLRGEPANVMVLSEDVGEQSISSRFLRTVYEDKEGNMWLATNQNGFNYVQFDGENLREITWFEREESGNGIAHRDGRSVYQQDENTFWLATYGGGIARWKKAENKITNFNSSDGLANNSTYGIVPDQNQRYIWISTNNGLSRLDTETLTFTNFTVADGLQNNEFNTGAYHQKENGLLFFGGVNGFNVINTKEIGVNDSPPPVYVTDIRLFNEPLNDDTVSIYQQEIILPYNENFLSFEFAALDYAQPLSVQYAHKLEGVDDDWVMTGNRNFADYPGLIPGLYTLKVKAANGDGVWNEEGTSVRVIIRPPWWATWWFRLISVTVIIIVFVSVIRHWAQRRLKEQIRKMEIENRLRNERERISRDLHDHVGAQLANIMSGLSLVDKYNEFDEKKKAEELVSSLRGDAQITIKQLRETIWALNQSELTVPKFVEHMKLYFKTQSALNATVGVSIYNKANDEAQLSSAQALNLFRIIQEAAQNTLKYAEATSLSIHFSQKGRQMELCIKDNGTFKSDNNSFNGGYGLKNMKKRAKDINADIELDTTQGTEIRISFNLEK